MVQKTWWLLAVMALAFLGGCAARAEGEPPPANPAFSPAITCHTAYRAGVGVPIGGEDVFVLAQPGAQNRAVYKDLELLALYSSGEGEGGRALALRVTPVGSDQPLTAQLYQFAPGVAPQNEFLGGHGFTGLGYAYHPASGAELQYWCTAGQE